MLNRDTTQNTVTGFTKFVLVIAIIYVFFFPTSYKGTIIYNMYIPQNLFAICVVLFCIFKNRVKLRSLETVLLLFLWLGILTVTTSVLCRPNDFRIAYASISAFIPTVLMWCVCFKDAHSASISIKWLNFLSIVVLIWGWGIVIGNGLIIEFTGSLYSQLTDEMFNNMVLLRGKPVMSFGTHSLSSFFLLLMFYLHCIVIKEKKENLFTYVCMFLLLGLQIPMRSTTSVLLMGVMALLFVWAKNNVYTRIFLCLVGMIIVIVCIKNGYLTQAIYILFGENSKQHGFMVRYFGDLYDGNFEMILKYIGVGFLRSDSDMFRMNDSGPIYLLTQGNIVALLAVYWLMYSFFKNNMNKYVKLTFWLFFLYELVSSVTFVTTEMFMAHVLVVFMINSICRTENKEQVSLKG